jgi:hypothetical protein
MDNTNLFTNKNVLISSRKDISTSSDNEELNALKIARC